MLPRALPRTSRRQQREQRTGSQATERSSTTAVRQVAGNKLTASMTDARSLWGVVVKPQQVADSAAVKHCC
jgi:hypothetical protein